MKLLYFLFFLRFISDNFVHRGGQFVLSKVYHVQSNSGNRLFYQLSIVIFFRCQWKYNDRYRVENRLLVTESTSMTYKDL
jgi:hypothetical protein